MSYNLISGLWTGSQYRNPENQFKRVLVIGHSTYGTPPDDPHGIEAWIRDAASAEDPTFNRWFYVAKKLRALKVDRSKRESFFAQFAFNNFVSHILGEKDRDPTAAEYKEAALKLPGVIAEANPRAIFAFGYAHRKHSEDVIEKSRIPYVFSVHPVQDKLKQFPPDWHQFVQMLNDLGD
jgi:hypothetical protein